MSRSIFLKTKLFIRICQLYEKNLFNKIFLKNLLTIIINNANIQFTSFKHLLSKFKNFLFQVYIYDGNIHLIPPDCGKNSPISVIRALCQIREKTLQTQASLGIQNSIKNKLDGYPLKINENLHRANVFIPVSIAAILKCKPNLIAPAVQAFCNRDSIDMNACRAMKYFPPENRVMSQVTFTKCLYAMLTHSKYVPDRRTGWKLPSVNSKLYKSNMLGVKLACGFEILLSQTKPCSDIHSDKGWHGFLKSLTDKGYFKSLLENSNEFNRLLNTAKEYYISHCVTKNYFPSIGQEILLWLKCVEFNSDEFKRECENLPNDDDDSWLNIEREELEKMLEERYGKKKIFNVNNNTDAFNFTRKISNFFNHVSDFEGAEFPEQNESPVIRGKKNKVSFLEDTTDEIESNKVNFDANSFACSVQNILNFGIPDDNSWDIESDSDMSEYEQDICVKKVNYENTKTKMKEYMGQMDKELANTTIGESFEKKNDETFNDFENFKPVDIDVNALKNILESYKFQMGDAGPSSNMLGPMGIHLDKTDKIGLN